MIPNIPAAPFCFQTKQPNLMFSPEKTQISKEIKLLNKEKMGKKCNVSSVSISSPGRTWEKGILITQTITFQHFPPKIAILPIFKHSFRIKNHTVALRMFSTGKSHTREIQDEFKNHQGNQNINTCISYFIHLKLALLLVSFPKIGSSQIPASFIP